MSSIELTPLQQRKLWALFVSATQGNFGIITDEDTQYGDKLVKYIETVEGIINEDVAPPNPVDTLEPNTELSENEQ